MPAPVTATSPELPATGDMDDAADDLAREILSEAFARLGVTRAAVAAAMLAVAASHAFTSEETRP